MSRCASCRRTYREPEDEQGEHPCPKCGKEPHERTSASEEAHALWERETVADMTRDELIETGYAGVGVDSREDYEDWPTSDLREAVMEAIARGDLEL